MRHMSPRRSGAHDVDRVRALLSHVTYRPGWTVEAFPTPYGGRTWVLIDAEVLDSEKYDPTIPVEENYRRGNTTRVGVRAVVPQFIFGAEFFDWLGKRLIRCERHESREFFKVDGTPWNDPHKVPQPPVDYWVRKRGGRWVVCTYSGPPVAVLDSWQAAYETAWQYVINDDLRKGSDMVNG